VRKQLGPYLEQKILAATPLELVTISYQCATQAVRDARVCLAEGNIKDRSGCITLAHGIVAELFRTLDRKAGDGSIPNELGRLYEYMMRRLLEANSQQTDAPLAEVLNLLSSLAEAWVEVSKDAIPAAAVSAPAPRGYNTPNNTYNNSYGSVPDSGPEAARPAPMPSHSWGMPVAEPDHGRYSLSF